MFYGVPARVNNHTLPIFNSRLAAGPAHAVPGRRQSPRGAAPPDCGYTEHALPIALHRTPVTRVTDQIVKRIYTLQLTSGDM